MNCAMKMGSWRHLLFLFLINLVGLTIAQPQSNLPNFLKYFCNFTSSSVYQTNLNTLLSTLSNKTDKYGFHNASYGENPNRAHAIVLCRGDLDLDTCHSCINNATSKLPQVCPNSKQAIGWYDYCMLRYSNASMEGIMAGDPRIFVWNPQIVTSVAPFMQALTTLLRKLRDQAASGGTLRKFATGNTSDPNSESIYALAQCTPDISEPDCTDCLQGAIDNIPLCCNGTKGGRVIRPSCHFRYETGRFYNEIPADAPPAASPPPSSPPQASPNNNTTVIIVVSTIGSVMVLIASICIFLRKRKQRKRRHKFEILEDGVEISSVESLQYDFETICIATDDFSDSNKLGQGGFGAVYKGMLSTGREIAVKRLDKGSGQGDLEFKNEVMLVAKLQHRNLVRLLGFCIEGTERLLIYEFVPNASLDHFIFDPIKRANLDWERRYKIIGGVARGLLYLHEDSRLQIIHRDLKASNVLLDSDMNPKISDFGMARMFVPDETHGSTNRIVGTYGYMAPEYARYGQFSVKSDVFSYGVLILEIISGQKTNHFCHGDSTEDLLTYAWRGWREGTVSNLIDPTLRNGSGSINEMMRCIHVGLLCVQDNVAHRPTMATVVLMLSSFSLSLPLPSEPTNLLLSSSQEQRNTAVNGSSQSINEVTITELYPR
ncbi:cysteine-rich receptor-like protein kinase 44 isoform X3 [Actinidia eriantha]|uniref:cysteine-rich receptor-like protein kinase 44 isoform X2 n=1 Tax=Actinidia eriantha TaxID=165200 RepID=UPI002585DEFF|nr:cysteine-rich receptor-like protein kinase 44 isoform X2 [Actinidia eriantha]XP_057488432.1 cysteine-rich receptor-like protein kinase 44 isoform X3 [Actinidia eriantha]